jgi:RNA polymerase sigma-70 factor (ECF subfamily)
MIREITDATLLRRCRRGDDLAWEALVRHHQSRLFSVAFNYMRDREEARDVTQDVFVKIYRQLKTLREGDAFLPWMLRIARNSCIDRLRHLKSRRPEIDVPLEHAAEIKSDSLNPEEVTHRGSRTELVQQALGTLGSTNREIIMLKDIQGLKLDEISDLLSLPLGTVKSRSHRARLELAQAVRTLDPSYGV